MVNIRIDKYLNIFYEVGRAHFGKDNLRTWFKGLYEILFGQTDGPRMGGFVNLLGREKTILLIQDQLANTTKKPSNNLHLKI